MTSRRILLVLTVINLATVALNVSKGNYGAAVFVGGLAIVMLAVAMTAIKESDHV